VPTPEKHIVQSDHCENILLSNKKQAHFIFPCLQTQGMCKSEMIGIETNINKRAWKFWQWCWWKFKFSGIWWCVWYIHTRGLDYLEDGYFDNLHTNLHSVISQKTATFTVNKFIWILKISFRIWVFSEVIHVSYQNSFCNMMHLWDTADFRNHVKNC